mmetsp:Transcript_4961/g.16030  ORF Transcript_4961/g.16030 Transcript_4961/m.16030 type:complete len:345 (-) Transcript_4961:220-1254(-)
MLPDPDMLIHVAAVHEIAHQGYRRGQTLRPVPPLAWQDDRLTFLHDDTEGGGGPCTREDRIVRAGRVKERRPASDGFVQVAVQVLGVLRGVADELLPAADLREPRVARKGVVMQPRDGACWAQEDLHQGQVEALTPLVVPRNRVLNAIQTIGYVIQKVLMLQEGCPPVRVEDLGRLPLQPPDHVWLPLDVADVLPHRCLDSSKLATTVTMSEERGEIVAGHFIAAKVLGQPFKRPLLPGRPSLLRIGQDDRLAPRQALHHLVLRQSTALVDVSSPLDDNLLCLGRELYPWRGRSRTCPWAAQGRQGKPELRAQGVLRAGKQVRSWLCTKECSSAPGHKSPAALL